MKSSNGKSDSRRKTDKKTRPGATRRSKALAAAIAGSFAVAVLIFWLVSSQGRIPPMPRATFSAEEEAAALKDLKGRIHGFAPTDEERDLIRLLDEVHRTETAEDGPENQAEIRRKIESFRAAASRLSGMAEERYLLLGDFLAVEFDGALEALLAKIRALSKNDNRAKGVVSFERIERLGGSFFSRCVSRGAITRDGRLLASRLAPEVLFRARWRLLGELRLEIGLSLIEKKAYYDFVAAFTSPHSENQRLAAVGELGGLDKSYDTVIARALVFHQAGKDADAYKHLQEAIFAGRGGAAVRNFSRAVRP
jgi:hypothetical protein